jgi:transcriptional regulator with PAS, ATPase and Fis domain
LKKYPNNESTEKYKSENLKNIFKKRILLVAIAIYDGNYNKAAESLNLKRTTLLMMSKRFNLTRKYCKIKYEDIRRQYEDLLGYK